MAAVKEAKRSLLEYGVTVNRIVGQWCMQSDGVLGMKELHNVLITVEDPFSIWHNKVNQGLLADTMDILLGLNPGYVHRFWKFYRKWLTSRGEYPYTYGERIFDESINQWNECADKLRHDPSTRQANIVISRPKDLRSEYTPCSVAMQFYTDDRQRLNASYEMRSNDIAIGGLPRNIFIGCQLLTQMSLCTGIPLGSYHHFDVNLHFYPNRPEDLEIIDSMERADCPFGSPALLDESQKERARRFLKDSFSDSSAKDISLYGPFDTYWMRWLSAISGGKPE